MLEEHFTSDVDDVLAALVAGRRGGEGFDHTVRLLLVPVAFAVGVLLWRTLSKHETDTKRIPVDFVGLALLITWVGALQVMLDKGKQLDWFHSNFIVALALIAAIGFPSFLIWELTDDHPIVDLRVFRHRGFTASSLVMTLAFGSFFATIVLLPLWLQTNIGYTATWAGRATAFQGVFAVIMSPIVARLTVIRDSRLLVSIGVLIFGAINIWRSTFTTDLEFMQIVWPQLTQGFAIPLFFIPLTIVALSSVEPRETTTSVAGLLTCMRSTAAAFATSITTTQWEDVAVARRVDIAALNTLTQAGSTAAEALRQLDSLVQTQAVMLATDRVFFVSAFVFVLAAGAIWLAPKAKRGGATAAAAH